MLLIWDFLLVRFDISNKDTFCYYTHGYAWPLPTPGYVWGHCKSCLYQREPWR
jgi:hypothetical protein